MKITDMTLKGFIPEGNELSTFSDEEIREEAKRRGLINSFSPLWVASPLGYGFMEATTNNQIYSLDEKLTEAKKEIKRLKGVVNRLQEKLEKRDRNDPEWKDGDLPFQKVIRWECD